MQGNFLSSLSFVHVSFEVFLNDLVETLDELDKQFDFVWLGIQNYLVDLRIDDKII